MNVDHITVRVAPIGDTTPPTLYLSGDIPIIQFGGGVGFDAAVEIHLGNHDDPVTYLRDFARNLFTFSDEIAASLGPVPA